MQKRDVGWALLLGGLALALSRRDDAAPSYNDEPYGPPSPFPVDRDGNSSGIGPFSFDFLGGAEPTFTTEPDADSEDDETALARMLASETSNYAARVVVGWQTIERARARGVSLFRLLTGQYGTYGPGPSSRPGVYASTARGPTSESRQLARQLLNGQVQPSAEVRSKGLGAWVEENQGMSAESLLKLQTSARGGSGFGGIWGRLAGTGWLLYDGDEPVITAEGGETAAQRLARVPTVSAV